MLDLLEDFMMLRKIPYARLDGSTSRPRRNLDIRLVSNICLIHAHLIIILLVPTREIAYGFCMSPLRRLTICRSIPGFLDFNQSWWIGYQPDKGYDGHHGRLGLESSERPSSHRQGSPNWANENCQGVVHAKVYWLSADCI
jgi:hypothetical protein